MKLLILSDLHNDIRPMNPEVNGRRVDAEADVVVLAGDIHEGVQAQMWARETFPDKPIVMVAGNHEFYGRFWNRNLRKMREKAESLGIHFLENDVLELMGLRFLGCTLWTDFNLSGEELSFAAMSEAKRRMTDYLRIQTDRKPGENLDWLEFRSVKLVPEMARRRHRESAAWLEDQLTQSTPEDLARTVVVTHHAPHQKSVPSQFVDDALSPAYASDLSRLLGFAPLWIHGHIHENADYMAGDTRVICNPRGYPDAKGEHMNESFNPAFIVEAGVPHDNGR